MGHTYRNESTYFCTDLPVLTGEQIEERCCTLSRLLTAAVCSGEITSTEIDATRRRVPSDSTAPAVPI